MKEQKLFRQSTLFVQVLSTLQKHVSKGLDKKRKNLVRLVIPTLDKHNGRLETFLDVYLKITSLKNVQSHIKRTRNGKSRYIVVKNVIVHVTTSKITVTKRYMHLWHVCLVMTNVLVESLVTTCNQP